MQSKCSERFILVLNLVACASIIVCIAFRFVYITDKQVAENRMVFYVVLSVYLVLFVLLNILAELKISRVRQYVNFLDTKFGRGMFLIFLGLLILENTSAVEIILSIFILLVGCFNVCIGFSQGSDSKEALQKKFGGSSPKRSPSQIKRDQQSAAPSSNQRSIELQNMRRPQQEQQVPPFSHYNQGEDVYQQQYPPDFANEGKYHQPQTDNQYYGGMNNNQQEIAYGQPYQLNVYDSQAQIENQMIEIELGDEQSQDQV